MGDELLRTGMGITESWAVAYDAKARPTASDNIMKQVW
jgi:hypothetical protein